MEFLYVLIPLLILVAIVSRVVAGAMDRDRVRKHVEKMGGKLLQCNWSPLGPGWFGDKDNRIYKVRYTDRNGAEHMAYCKTSFWSGVYFTRDKVVQTGTSGGKKSLVEENQRLREELERLKRGGN